MWDIYYIETDTICLVILFTVFYYSRVRSRLVSSSRLMLRRIIFTTAAMCVSDAIAGLLHGKQVPCGRFLVYASNIIYSETIILVALLWCLYVFLQTGIKLQGSKRASFLIPFWITTALLITDPLTGLIFNVDPNNVYSRGSGMWMLWGTGWFYMLTATVAAFWGVHNASGRIERERRIPMLYFMTAPTIGALIQMVFYGVTSTQVGITIAILILVLRNQDSQISVDELTGINNRRALRVFLTEKLEKIGPTMLTVIMIDINHFKKINDTMGHAAGDQALTDMAKSMKQACGQIPDFLFLSRYSGDEFVLVGRDVQQERLHDYIELIRKEAAAAAIKNDRPYALEISVGTSSGICADWEDFLHHLHLADEAMYEEKKRCGALRAD